MTRTEKSMTLYFSYQKVPWVPGLNRSTQGSEIFFVGGPNYEFWPGGEKREFEKVSGRWRGLFIRTAKILN